MTENSVRPPQSAMDGWTPHQLGDPEVSTITMGQSPESETYNVSGIGLPFFQGKADFGLRHPTPRTWCSTPTRVAEAGDILLSVRAPVGDVNIARERCCIGRGIAALRPNLKVHGEFLFYSLMDRKGDLDALGSGAIFKAINKDTLLAFEIQLPPFPEQQAIAAVLAKIQAAVEVQERIIATLKELKAATMAKLFREGAGGEGTPRRETRFGEVPAAWGTTLLGEVAHIQTGVAKGRRIRGESATVEVPYLRVANVQDGYLDLAEIKTIELRTSEVQRYALQAGDVLLTEGGDFDKLGRGYLWNGQIAGCAHQNHIFAVRTERTRLLPDFFAYLAQSHYGKAYFLTVAHKTTNLASINSSKLKAFPILLPTLEEQGRIATVVRNVDEALDLHTGRFRRLMSLFSSMLHLLMTGRVRVSVEGEGGGEVVARRDAVLEKVEQFVAELARQFEPERVILFGQPAEGSPRAFGEVGLLVEMEFEGLARDQGARMAHEIPHDFSLDLVVRRPEDVARAVEMGDAFIKGVLERGRTLHVRPGGVPVRREKAPRRETPPRRGGVSEETLREIVQRIVETVQPERIILFGSAARGEMGPDSDVDLLVVKDCGDRRETARTISWHLIGVAPGLPKDVIVVTPEDVERDRDTIGLIIRPALREGRVVYAA